MHAGAEVGWGWVRWGGVVGEGAVGSPEGGVVVSPNFPYSPGCKDP